MKLMPTLLLLGLVILSVLLIAVTAPVNSGVWEPIYELKVKTSDLQTQIDNIQLIPGPPGPPGETVHLGNYSGLYDYEYEFRTWYPAYTDGFVVVTAFFRDGLEDYSSPVSGWISPDAGETTYAIVTSRAGYYEGGGFTMPVKAGWYWKVDAPYNPTGQTRILWIPLSSSDTLPPHDT